MVQRSEHIYVAELQATTGNLVLIILMFDSWFFNVPEDAQAHLLASLFVFGEVSNFTSSIA